MLILEISHINNQEFSLGFLYSVFNFASGKRYA